jgi:hypothetical protein
MTADELRREARKLQALYMLRYPDENLPDETVRRAATEQVLEMHRRRQREIPDAFLKAWDQ